MSSIPYLRCTFLLKLLLCALIFSFGVPAAAADYSASIPCTGPPTLTPDTPIIRVKGAADTLSFEVVPKPGVTVTVKNWRINGNAIFDQDGNMTAAAGGWGTFVAVADKKTFSWTLGGNKEEAFTLTAIVRRGCGPGGEDKEEEIELWGGEITHIESIAWEAIDSPLSSNEGGGQRIFPGKASPTDTVVRNTVRVKVTVAPVKENVSVYLRSLDVDDPSSAEAPLDDDSNGTDGGDNRGGGALQATIVKTNAEGIATADFTTSMQPGDNFRVAASLAQGELAALTTDQVPDGDNSKYVVFGNAQIMDFKGKITDTLTIWRRLHVEVDSMGEVTGNTVEGEITRIAPGAANTNTSVCTTNQTLNDSSVEPGRFESGILKDSDGKTFTVVSNTANANFTVTVKNIVDGENQTVPADGEFELVDDDPTHGGGDGAEVPEPNTSLLVEKFKPAFIEVMLDGADFGWNQNDAPFHLNLASATPSGLEVVAKESRQSSSQPNFWTVQCVGAFQPTKDTATGGTNGGDADPSNRYGANGQWLSGENTTQGFSSWISAFVFSESHQEFGYKSSSYKGHIMLHEVGHSFRLPDEYLPPLINQAPYNDPNYRGIMKLVWGGNFMPVNLATIRSTIYPSH